MQPPTALLVVDAHAAKSKADLSDSYRHISNFGRQRVYDWPNVGARLRHHFRKGVGERRCRVDIYTIARSIVFLKSSAPLGLSFSHGHGRVKVCLQEAARETTFVVCQSAV